MCIRDSSSPSPLEAATASGFEATELSPDGAVTVTARLMFRPERLWPLRPGACIAWHCGLTGLSWDGETTCRARSMFLQVPSPQSPRDNTAAWQSEPTGRWRVGETPHSTTCRRQGSTAPLRQEHFTALP